MAVTHITNDVVAALRRGEAVWDDSVQGFGVRRQRKAAVYILKYSHMNRQRFITLGHHCFEYSADHARAVAAQHKSVLAPGRHDRQQDPTIAAPACITFSDLAEEYMVRHAALRKEKRSLAEDRRNLDLHILPELGTMKIEAIGRAEVAAFYESRAARPTNANRCLSLLSHIFSKAEQWGRREKGSNPCRGLGRRPETPRNRVLSDSELLNLGKALNSVDAWKGRRPFPQDWRAVQVIRLLVLTGAKLTEILSLEWDAIDWEGGSAHRVARHGTRKIPLPSPALSILRAIRERQGAGTAVSRFVFPEKTGKTHFTGIHKAWQQVRRIAEIEDVRLNDLRHTFAATAAAEGEERTIVGAVQGLKTGRSDGGEPPRFGAARASSERTAIRLAAHMTPKAPSREPRAKDWRF